MDKRGQKRGDNSWIAIAIVVAIAVYALNLGGVQGIIAGLGAAAPVAPAPGQPPATGGLPADFCAYDGATMTIGPMKEKWNPTTSMAAKGARIFVAGVDLGVKADSSTLDVNYDDEVVVYYGENETEGSAGYYTSKQVFRVPCTSAFTSASRGEEYKMVATEAAAGNMSLKFFNEDNGNLNADGDAETLAAGDVVQLETKYQPTYEDGWSPNCQGVVVLEGNSSVFDKLEFAGWTATATPAQHTVNNTDMKTWSYEVPMIALPPSGAYGIQSTSLLIDVGTIDPGTQHGIYSCFYDCDYYRHSDTGAVLTGVETDTDGDVGRDNFCVIVKVD